MNVKLHFEVRVLWEKLIELVKEERHGNKIKKKYKNPYRRHYREDQIKNKKSSGEENSN